MCRNKILEKLLAVILIFTLTFANFAFTTEALATTIADSLFGDKSGTGHENIEFEAYFGTEEEKDTSVISDVKNNELSINMDLNVKDKGYLKDAKIEILESEEGKGLNFELKSFAYIDEITGEENYNYPAYVQDISDNVITLQQVNADSEVNINLPIEFKDEDYINENKLSSTAVVRVTGVYVDNEGEENEIFKDINLTVNWKDEREVRVESDDTKYINFERGVIIQTLVRIDTNTEENTLPIRQSVITIGVPEYEGNKPSNVKVVANSTVGTNGQTAENVSFNEENWVYNTDENTLTITTNNEKQLVEVNEFSDEFLKEEQEVISEERYYNIPGVDEYLITYTYDNVTAASEAITLSSNINARVITLSGDVSNDNVYVTENNNSYEYLLDSLTEDIVSLKIETETENISKAYIYANYNNSKYENEIVSNAIVNISYKDLVKGISIVDEDDLYKDKNGNEIVNNDIYYKQISISKDNFDAMLGAEGYIDIYDVEGNKLSSINSKSNVNENGMIVINFDNTVKKLVITTSAPIAEGNIVINKVKAIKNSSVSREEMINMLNMSEGTALNVKYEYVDTAVVVGTNRIEINLEDTTTNATLNIDRNSLSTLAMNENVEIRVELNNATDKSDLYTNSAFEVTLPEYVETVDITNVNMIYGEGLDITSATINDKTIRIEVAGTQEGINSGVLTNGTNIVINANIKVNLFAPAKTDKILLRYENQSATAYSDNGYEELIINYSAPSGLVAVNTISNFDNVGSQLTSVRQGEQEALIESYAEAKQATMEIVVMNNNGNSVSNVVVLGRIPTEGVKDIATGEDLGTTVNTRLVSGIVPDERNNVAVNVYYSENLEATKDLDDVENGWTMNPETLDNIKSYLIVPQDENYVMEDTDVLRFTYVYEIPSDLSKNNDIFGTFLAYYTNNSELAITDETSTPDKVGLTTGEGPEISLSVTSDSTEVREYEDFVVYVTVTNTGKETANHVNAEYTLSNNAAYQSSEVITQNAEAYLEGNKVIIKADTLEVEQSIEVKIILKAEDNVMLDIDDDSEGEMFYVEDGDPYDEPAISNGKNSSTAEFASSAIATCDDLGTVLEETLQNIEVESADLTVEEEVMPNVEEDVKAVVELGREFKYKIVVRNISNNDLNNVVIEKLLPNELTFVKAYENGDMAEASVGNYDDSSRTFSITVPTLGKGDIARYNVVVKLDSLDESVTEKNIITTTQARADGTDVYVSNETSFLAARPVLEITQTSDRPDTYIKEGDTVTFTFTIKNSGSIGATNFELKDRIPDGLKVQRIAYVANGTPISKYISKNEDAVVRTEIPAHSELVVNVKTVAQSLEGAQEKTVTNYATVASDTMPEQDTNSITHIVEQNEEYASSSATVYEEVASTERTQTNNTANTTSKTYKLNGVAFVDSNNNGARDDNEEKVAFVTARLVNSQTGSVVRTETTDSQGNYSFNGIENGSYLVVFDYDTVKYTVTTYQKEGVASNLNSDAVTTQVEQNGKKRNAAVTDVIQILNGSKSNIDIGLVYADTFDLSLTKEVTKVTVQNSQGTNTVEYEGETLVKTEIGSKYVTGSVVFIEYTFTVANVGDVTGYAKVIADYLPKDMTFNSQLNPDWYTGTDGNLYYAGLANTQLIKGQQEKFKLVLTKQMTEDNVGIINNVAEIYEDYNIYGISDVNSTPGNNAQGENDMGSANVLVLVKTGETLVYVSVIITSILLGSVVVFAVYTKLFILKRKRGV